jgi:hypothetical protein
MEVTFRYIAICTVDMFHWAERSFAIHYFGCSHTDRCNAPGKTGQGSWFVALPARPAPAEVL